MKHNYRVDTLNGRFRIYIDDYVFLSFNQIEFLGYYAFKDDVKLYGIDFYLKGGNVIETIYKTKELWLDMAELLTKEL